MKESFVETAAPVAAVSVYREWGNEQMTIKYNGTTIHISKKGFEEFNFDLNNYTGCALVSDNIIYPFHGEQIKKKIPIPLVPCIFPAGEQSKTLETATNCWRTMTQHNLDRRSVVIGFGGGVVTDIAGFVAASYMRGIDLIQVPSTLLGMVDAAIGGKSGVNLPEGKNLVGAIYQPKQIFISIPLLNTLPQRELSSGLAEVIKYGLIKDQHLFDYLEKHMDRILKLDPEALYEIIDRSCRIKADFVLEDEREFGMRAYLNFGHTIAHALETITHYNTFAHGEAVAIGMCCITRMSIELGLCSPDLLPRIETLCKKAKLPTKIPKGLDIDHFIELMSHDKKAQSKQINLILVEKIGSVTRYDNADKKQIKKIIEQST